ncbi:MAG: 4-(cytidine 5'-diphospho)-2-C-methyl-D-erythritol kinase [Clostridiales bacterium]|jgi:4-diphosphocytidyl-2-C-methyl-D-erythritol kinase|nr:4-(cytidine 5'-diphospho)-2-C-methyl-D-erythritol kinase [Clostridiales bacterium]
MDVIILKARAKINLALEVVGKREDGYHDLRMLMQTLYLHDTLTIKKTEKYPFKLATDSKRLPTDDRNLAWQAAMHMINKFGIKDGVFMHIQKVIPLAAGLAGGSTDCAAVIVGFNRMFSLGLSVEEMMAIGKLFGADVPYCLLGGLCKAEGIGDRLTRLPGFKSVSVVLAKPPISVSTAQVYKDYVPDLSRPMPDIDQMIAELASGEIEKAAKRFMNDLEPANIIKHPEIGAIKRLLAEAGACGAMMSGSGPSVFGFFSKQKNAWLAMKSLKKAMPRAEIYLTGTCGEKDVWQ